MKERSETPFREEFKDRSLGTGGFATVREFENDPRWVVKEIRIGDLEHNIGEAKQSLRAAKKFLADFVPETHLVVGKNEVGREVLFMAQERVQGIDMYDLLFKTRPKTRDEKMKKLETAIDGLFADSVGMYLNTYDEKAGTGVLADLKLQNIIVGRKEGDTDDGVYLVDIYPVLRTEPHYFYRDMSEWAAGITGFYQMRMPRFRAALKKILPLVKEDEYLK